MKVSLPAFSGVRLDLEFYDLANPDRLRSRAKFSGEVGLIDITDSIASIKEKYTIQRRRAALEIPHSSRFLGRVLWIAVYDSQMRKSSQRPLRPVGTCPTDLSRRCWARSSKRRHRNSFSLVLLARGLFLAGRLADKRGGI